MHLLVVFLTTLALSLRLSTAATLQGKLYLFTSNETRYNGREIHANGGKFWFNKPTKQICISDDGYGVCPDSPQTVATGGTGSYRKPTNLSLTPYYRSTKDPAGQQIYIAKDGSMSFLLNGDKVPASALTSKFASAEFAIYAVLGPNSGLAPYVCPNGHGTQAQIFWGASQSDFPSCQSASMTYGIDYPASKYA